MLISWSHIYPHHLKRLKYFLIFYGLTITLKLRMKIYFENFLIMIWISYHHSYLKMGGSYHGSISKMNMNETNGMFFQRAQLKHAVLTRWKTLFSNYSDVDEKYLYQLMSSKELEFCLMTNCPLSSYIWF